MANGRLGNPFVLLLLACARLLCASAAAAIATRGRDVGALGPGTTGLNSAQAAAAVEDYKRIFEGRHGDDLRKHGTSLACSACRIAVNRFKSKVARKIKAKASEEQRRQIFETQLSDVCTESGFAGQFAVVEKNSKEIYVDFADAMANREGKVSVKRMSPEVGKDLLAACRHLLHSEAYDTLLQRILTEPRGGKMSRIDFTGWLCGPRQARVCEEDEDFEEDEL